MNIKDINLEPVKEFIKTGGKVVSYLLVLGVVNKIGNNITKHDDWVIIGTYSEAVKAITESNMYSGDKAEAIQILKRYETSDFYRAVINIVNNSSLYSGDKIETIKKLCKVE